MDKQKDFEKGWEEYKAKKKQEVDELAEDIENSGVFMVTDSKTIARVVIDLGYRKIPEGAVVLTREEYEELQKGVKTHNYTATFNALEADRWLDGYKLGFKEGITAVEIQLKNELKTDYINGTRERAIAKIDEIAKEIMES